MERLTEGAQALGLALNPLQLQQFQDYYHSLVEGNRRSNLTRIIGTEEVQVKHFLDSLAAAPLLMAREGWRNDVPRSSLLDLGSGAGFPGMPLGILFPTLRLALLDSVEKKTAFLRSLLQRLRLEASVLTGRAEDLALDPHHREHYDLVIARGVAKLPVLAELMLPFCSLGGLAIAWRQGAVEQEVAQASHALELVGGRLAGVQWYKLPGIDRERALVLLEKVGATPDTYPRRAGIPTKRPL